MVLVPVVAVALLSGEACSHAQTYPDYPDVPEEAHGPLGAPGNAEAYQRFYDELSPHGEWLEREPYGRVWRPRSDVVGADFQPYATNGTWIYTDAGWSFASNWDWGWAVFHYGRWTTLAGLGWVWVPGTTWGPSWCEWRVSDDYVGWAPLPPAGYAPAIAVTAWTFVPTSYFIRPNVYRYAIPRYRLRNVFYRSRPVTATRVLYGTRYRVGPSPVVVSRAVGAPVRPLSVRPPRPGVVRAYRVRPGRVEVGPRPGYSPGGRGMGPGRPGPGPRPVPGYRGRGYGYPPAQGYSPGFGRGQFRPAPGQRPPRTTYYPTQRPPRQVQPGPAQPRRFQPGRPAPPSQIQPGQPRPPGQVRPGQPAPPRPGLQQQGRPGPRSPGGSPRR